MLIIEPVLNHFADEIKFETFSAFLKEWLISSQVLTLEIKIIQKHALWIFSEQEFVTKYKVRIMFANFDDFHWT